MLQDGVRINKDTFPVLLVRTVYSEDRRCGHVIHAGSVAAGLMTRFDEPAELIRSRRLARLFDSAFVLPGTQWRFGIDALIGLIPGLGDLAAGGTAVYIVYLGRRLGMPFSMQLRMLGNVLIDLLAGTIPLLGDLFDAHYKANLRNVALMEAYWRQKGEQSDPL